MPHQKKKKRKKYFQIYLVSREIAELSVRGFKKKKTTLPSRNFSGASCFLVIFKDETNSTVIRNQTYYVDFVP